MKRNVLLVLAALAAACGGSAPAANVADGEFITVNKSGAAATANPDEQFYVAISKAELGKKYFLSAYITQYFPGAVAYGAARSLGTRVVSFKVQNGKLFVFDVADTHKDSNTFDPSLIVDAYPIVDGVLPAAQAANYVAFDPAAGLNSFNALSDAFSGSAVKFKLELSYLQRFRKITDGVTFEQVFTGYADASDPMSWLGGENNSFRASGTLGIALRKYSEGAGFQQGALYDNPYFFMSDLRLVPNSGQITASSIKWNFKPGMKPVKWLISEKVKNLAKDPVLGQYDVYGSLKNAIENWNTVFGYKVFEASMATASDSYGDDDTNYVLWDEDPSYGAAFANWRTNPNTGEIRGASVYMNAGWVSYADQAFTDSATPIRGNGDGTPELLAAPVAAPRHIPTLAWAGMPEQPLCILKTPDLRLRDEMIVKLAANTTMTKKQKVEAFLTHVLVHEIGHTLGLRHNFKGSLVAPATSVMDYLTDDDSLQRTLPGSYDTDAIKLLYGMSQTIPAQPFCTDDNIGADPDCQMFDTGASPLAVTYAPYYTAYLAAFLKGQVPTPPNNSLNGVLQFVRAGTTDEMTSAWTTTIAPIKVPVSASLLSQPGYAARVDAASYRVLTRLFLDPAANRGDYVNNPGAGTPVWAGIFAEVQGNLLNTDGARSFTTRRAMVDILKQQQSMAAYNVLLSARTQIAAGRSALTGDAAALTDDLLSRIDGATHPYFQ